MFGPHVVVVWTVDLRRCLVTRHNSIAQRKCAKQSWHCARPGAYVHAAPNPSANTKAVKTRGRAKRPIHLREEGMHQKTSLSTTCPQPFPPPSSKGVDISWEGGFPGQPNSLWCPPVAPGIQTPPAPPASPTNPEPPAPSGNRTRGPPSPPDPGPPAPPDPKPPAPPAKPAGRRPGAVQAVTKWETSPFCSEFPSRKESWQMVAYST